MMAGCKPCAAQRAAVARQAAAGNPIGVVRETVRGLGMILGNATNIPSVADKKKGE